MSETITKIVPAEVCINGLTVTFQVEVVSQGFPGRKPRTVLVFPRHKTVSVLEAELLKPDVYLHYKSMCSCYVEYSSCNAI